MIQYTIRGILGKKEKAKQSTVSGTEAKTEEVMTVGLGEVVVEEVIVMMTMKELVKVKVVAAETEIGKDMSKRKKSLMRIKTSKTIKTLMKRTSKYRS